jgi:peptide/nickel transport system substrate-binding protein
MASSYWDKVLEQRTSRRAVVVGGAGLAGAAALLAACGGGSDSGGGEAQAGKFKVFTDSKAETPVKSGGIYKKHISGDLPSLDPYKQTAAAPNTEIGTYAMNRLVEFKTGAGVEPNNYEVAPALAESWEVSDGGLTYTFKLRQGVKFHNIAPVSGHAFDSEDVTASYTRFSTGTGGVGGALAGTVGAPAFGNSFKGVVDSVTAPDKNTVVFKLTKPNSAFLNILATYLFFHIFPREASITYDPSKTVIGTGPFQVSNYQPSLRIEYTKNPDYWEKGLPYVDGAVTYFIGETAQQLAQFQAGSIYRFEPLQFGDFQALLNGTPDLRIIASGIQASVQGIGFNGVKVDNPNAPWLKDARVRHAFSLAMDRQSIMESFNDVDKYKSIGLDRAYRFGNFVPPNLEKYWIDPRGKEMGESAQWFQYDVAKAKQLMSAAGFANGIDVDFHVSINNTNDQYYNAQPIMKEWWEKVGIRAKIMGEDYASVFNPHSWHGEGDGISSWGWQTFSDPGQQLDYLFGPTSTRNQMGVNDPKFNQMQEQQYAELDQAKRRAILVQMYQYLSDEMRHIPHGYQSIDTFILHTPNVRNNGAFRSSDSQTATTGTHLKNWWLAS